MPGHARCHARQLINDREIHEHFMDVCWLAGTGNLAKRVPPRPAPQFGTATEKFATRSFIPSIAIPDRRGLAVERGVVLLKRSALANIGLGGQVGG